MIVRAIVENVKLTMTWLLKTVRQSKKMVIQGGVPAYVHAYGVSHFELITRRLRPLDLYTVPRLTNEIRVSCPLSAGHLSKQN